MNITSDNISLITMNISVDLLLPALELLYQNSIVSDRKFNTFPFSVLIFTMYRSKGWGCRVYHDANMAMNHWDIFLKVIKVIKNKLKLIYASKFVLKQPKKFTIDSQNNLLILPIQIIEAEISKFFFSFGTSINREIFHYSDSFS